MASLEWAHIEAFDNAEWPRLTPEQMAAIGEQSQLTLQPYLQLIEAHYAIDDALIALRHENGSSAGSSNNASTGHTPRRTRSLRNLPRQAVFLAIHRFEDGVYYRRIAREDYQLLRALRQHAPLGDALDAAFEESAMPEEERPAYLQSAFGYWSAMGWFCTRPSELLDEDNDPEETQLR